MQLTTTGSRIQWDFEVISKDHENNFVHAVLEDYEYTVGERFEINHEDELYSVQTFIYAFQESYMVFESVMEDELHPDLDWEKLSDNEQSDIHEAVAEESARYFNEYSTDVIKVLEFYQLFYISNVFIPLQRIHEDVNRYKNSPLQEVW